MPHLSTQSRGPVAAIALPILLLACGGLTACGSSSSSTSTKAANAGAATTAATPGSPASPGTPGAPGTPSAPVTKGPGAQPNAARFTAVRTCLQKNGVTLPAPAAGGTPVGAARSAPKLPKGMTREHYLEVLKSCGGRFRGPQAFNGGGNSRRAFDNPRLRTALVAFAACLRRNGVNVPEPSTSGKGPIFGTKGIDVRSPKFKAAQVKCRATLIAGLRNRARPGTAAPGATPGAAGPG